MKNWQFLRKDQGRKGREIATCSYGQVAESERMFSQDEEKTMIMNEKPTGIYGWSLDNRKCTNLCTSV